uniref:SCP domain-containing protein n=1 Tax=Tetradesmus obliquus TaxID=3088 RepID=A0A383WF23_TETOB|eukprot:jgi/Sobl393_1/7063/SZX75679.1
MVLKMLLPALLLLLLAAADAQQAGQTGSSSIPPTAPFTTPQRRTNIHSTASTSTPSIASSTPAQAAAPAQYQEILSLHNSYRAGHAALPLAWDASLAESASRVVSSCNFKHSGLETVGENMAAFWDCYDPQNTRPARALKGAIDSWYNEVAYYNFSNPGFYTNYNAGHFTQVVWLATSRIGCATAFCNGNFQIDLSWVSGRPPVSADMVVCHYAPAGNLIGADEAANFRHNVLPKGSVPPGAPDPPQQPPAAPSPSPSPAPNVGSGGSGPTLIGSSLAPGQSISTGTCLFSDNQLYRLCLNSFGEIVVMNGARANTVRWRNSVPLGTRSSNRPPYTLTLNNDYTVTVKNGDNRLLSMIALPGPPSGSVSLQLRNDGKAAVMDAAGRCIIAWGSGPGMPAGC